MLRDITIGQFIPGESIIHKIDPRFKIVFVVAATVMIFISKTFVGIGICAAFIILCAALSGVHAKLLIRSFKPLLPFIIFTVILNMLYSRGGTVLLEWWVITITLEGIYASIMMTLRIVLMLLAGSLLTFTTSPIVLTDAIERLMYPLSWIKVPVRDIAMMMTIALRFIPTLIDETEKIMNAQKARGASLESGKLMQRAKAMLPILIPLFVSAFKRAEELALAMECRCYTGGKGRTRLKQMKCRLPDFVSAFVIIAVLAAIVYANSMFTNVL